MDIYLILLILGVIFLILCSIFNKQISNWLKDKHDWNFVKTKNPNKKFRIPFGKGKFHEGYCRNIFEKIFNKPFPTVRPNFLKRTNNRVLELDGYNQELKLAFEYNGIQHYKFTPAFHSSLEDLRKQIQRDEEKKQLCKRAGVILIEIPYTVKKDKFENFIKTKLKNLGYL
jgi:hypothetical protein